MQVKRREGREMGHTCGRLRGVAVGRSDGRGAQVAVGRWDYRRLPLQQLQDSRHVGGHARLQPGGSNWDSEVMCGMGVRRGYKLRFLLQCHYTSKYCVKYTIVVRASVDLCVFFVYS